jgi:tetratricopeptide (TPR) repeat protein
VKVGFADDEAHVDIDQQRLLREVMVRGNFLMDRHRHDQAWELLLAALELYPGNSILLYNAACVNALMYHQARALQLLKEAVDAGYNDARHMLEDEDLENVRRTPEFAALYERMTGKKFQEPPLPRRQSSPAPPPLATPADAPPSDEMIKAGDKQLALPLPAGCEHNEVPLLVPASPLSRAASSSDRLLDEFVIVSDTIARSPSDRTPSPLAAPAMPATVWPSTTKNIQLSTAPPEAQIPLSEAAPAEVKPADGRIASSAATKG